MHSIINVFLTQAFSRNVIGRKCASNWSCYCFLFEKNILKCFVQCRILALSTPGQRPGDQNPVNTSHGS